MMTVTVSNEINLKKAKDLLNAKTDSEAIELALEIVVREFEKKESSDLPDSFFEELFAEKTELNDGESLRAIVREREESKF